MASKDNLGPLLSLVKKYAGYNFQHKNLFYLVEEGWVGHCHPGHFVVLPTTHGPSSHLPAHPVGHSHLLGKWLDVRHRCSIDLKLLRMTCVSSMQCSGGRHQHHVLVQSTGKVQSGLSVPFKRLWQLSIFQSHSFQCRFQIRSG